MKTRSDFVSNSSSSSFVVAIPDEKKYKFKNFVKDVVKDCATCIDEDYKLSKEQLAKLNAFNARNLEYHLNSSELLFLGRLTLKDQKYVVKHPSISDKKYDDADDYDYDCKMFEDLQKEIKKKNFGKTTGEKVISATDVEIAISYEVCAHGIAIPSMGMDSFTMHYHHNGNDDSNDKIYAYKNIMDLMNNIKDPNDSELYHFFNTSMYFISKKTIWNTRALLENGAVLTFEKWEDLDALEKRLDEGQRLFVIRQNNAGDGWDNNAIYALGGWDAKFGENATVEVLYSECM